MADGYLRQRKNKAGKFAELRRAREGGGRIWKQEDDTDLYDEVSEDQYKSIVKGRLAKDDFVVDDGIDGYMDNGMDDWGADDEAVHSDEELPKSKSKSKKNASTDVKLRGKPKAPPPPSVVPSMTAYRPAKSAEQESDFMASVLGDMDTIATTKPTIKSRKRKPSPESQYRSYDRSSSPPAYACSSSDGQYDDVFVPSSPDRITNPSKKAKTDTIVIPALEQFNHLDVHSSGGEDLDFDASFDDIDEDMLMEINQSNPSKIGKIEVNTKPLPVNFTNGKVVETKKKKEEDVPAWLSVYDSLSVTTDDTLGSSPDLGSSSSVNASKISALEPDGSFRFFWLDYLEHEGKIYFIGKLKDKTSGAWVSCCVTVEGLQRNLFVLPRERRLEKDEDGHEYDTDIVPQLPDVYNDFDAVRRRAGVKSWKAKFVKRKYAFGDKDVPRDEAQWMKVVYGFDEPQIQPDVSSPNFSKIFGTNTTAFELLVLKRKIMGPCWLQIKKPQLENKGVSWCKLEATVSDPKDINPFRESDPDAPKETPPLTVMSLSIRTIVNHRENKREIVCVTARIWTNLQIEDPTPPESLPCSVHTFVRPLDRFPPNFETRAKANSKGYISPMKNERMLLNSLLVTIHKTDPDVILGHEFLGVSLDVLLHRMREVKADHWSRVGRFRRSKWPNIGRQGTNIKFLNGRLLCDLASDGAKGMIVSTTWSLTEMCKAYLKSERQDIDPEDTAGYFDGTVSTPDRLLTFVRHCELDAHYQMALAAKVQILPLTKQLTNLAGNSWNKTLNGGRAERNEYILLHEFHRLKYVCPDKFWQKRTPAIKKKEPEDDFDSDAEGPKSKKTAKPKRDKYKGGLVLSPKQGLCDKYVLVMDFNSLYPSIIQEYNIDFTTIRPIEADNENDDEDTYPEPPPPEVGQGVLPRLIATLVNRRRQVKSLMKDKTIAPVKMMQYDLKQMALKLTANSMYGCLGFENSRFYARDLAALTTFKGREILTDTKELAESLNLEVLYGDTDSIFVNSNVTELSEAMAISAALKKAVNDRYKLLEIDLDGIFKRLLLLQKKKYAAIKVEDGSRTSTEVKGLDMKRREFSALSKNVSQYVLEQILSGEATEVVVENIHEYLRIIGENVREAKVKLEDFIIFKRLGKNPEDYPDGKGQPHVQVALRMKSKGGTARAGDVVPYIFCLGPGGETSKTGQADRARHPDEVRRVGSDCKIDYEYYLSQQILPPIERLCGPIQGTDRSRLAQCLGLDPTLYRSTTIGDAEERYFCTLDSQIPESQRYQDAEPFRVRCRYCKEESEFAQVGDREKSLVLTTGPTCPSCKQSHGVASIQTQLETQIREHISKYYLGWTVCDDPTCGNRTRMMSVYGKRCLKPGCLGHVAFEYSDTQLYNQLRYYSYLFDGERARKNAMGSLRYDEVVAVTGNYATFLETMKWTVERYLHENGRKWVDMSGLFTFMKL